MGKSVSRLTLYQLHKRRWQDGCGSDECPGARRRCFMRGRLPCDVLFVGEAPGDSENCIGQPFVGPAGHLLDQVVSRSVPEGVRWAMTNVVACIPLEVEGGVRRKRDGGPSVEQVQHCTPRLQELVAIARPRLVVCVGAVARDWLDLKMSSRVRLPGDPIPRVSIDHPASILRMPTAQQGLAVRRACVTVTNAVYDLLVRKEGE